MVQAQLRIMVQSMDQMEMQQRAIVNGSAGPQFSAFRAYAESVLREVCHFRNEAEGLLALSESAETFQCIVSFMVRYKSFLDQVQQQTQAILARA